MLTEYAVAIGKIDKWDKRVGMSFTKNLAAQSIDFFIMLQGFSVFAICYAIVGKAVQWIESIGVFFTKDFATQGIDPLVKLHGFSVVSKFSVSERQIV